MGRKQKTVKETFYIPRLKKEKACARDFLKNQKKKPSMPLDDLKNSAVLRERRQKKRAEKREKQRRNDVSISARSLLEKCAESFQSMEVTQTKC